MTPEAGLVRRLPDLVYRTAEVARLADVNTRQLDYWGRIGLIVPEYRARGTGWRHRYSSTDLLLVAVVVEFGLLSFSNYALVRPVLDALRRAPNIEDATVVYPVGGAPLLGDVVAPPWAAAAVTLRTAPLVDELLTRMAQTDTPLGSAP